MIKKDKVSYKFLLLELALFLVLLAIDLISKYYVNYILPNVGDSKVIIPKIFTFIYSENTGASFGIFRDYPIALTIISSITALGMILFMLLKRNVDKSLRLTLVLIISGAIGNIYDRIVFGYVRDFIHYTFLRTYFNINFAIGNVADIFLTVGALLLIVYVIFVYKDNNSPQKTKESDDHNSSLSAIETSEVVDFCQEEELKGANRSKSKLKLTNKIDYNTHKVKKNTQPIKSKLEISEEKSFESIDEMGNSSARVKDIKD